MTEDVLDPLVDEFWTRACQAVGRDSRPGPDAVGGFGSTSAMANELALLVVTGPKRATARLLAAHEAADEPLPRRGGLSVVVDGGGVPVAVIETTDVVVAPLDGVDADFAHAEGEGDGSLAHWKRAHDQYFSDECERLGITFHRDLNVVFERFELLWPTPQDGADPLVADALLVDLDGVLADSTAVVESAWGQWADEAGVGHDQLVDLHGIPAAQSMARLRPDLDPQTQALRLEELELAQNDRVEIVAGARRFVASLDAGTWAIVTSGTRELASRRLDKIGITPPAVFVTADDVDRGKPDPAPYRLAAQRLGMDPSRCVVVEDAPAGIEAGAGAGAAVVGVATTHEPATLAAASRVVADTGDLIVMRDPAGHWGIITATS